MKSLFFLLVYMLFFLQAGCMFNAQIIPLEQTGHASNNSIGIGKISANISSSTTFYDEKSSLIEINIELSDISSLDIPIDFTIDGTATGNGVDYNLLTSSPVVIPKGTKFAKIKIQPIDDANETIVILKLIITT